MSLRIAMAVLGLALVAPQVHAGRSNGRTGVDQSRVEAFSTVRYEELFRGGERAEVTIVGDGDTDLDLFVYNEEGVQVTSNTNGIDRATVSWYAPRTGRYRIVVKNLGSVYNEFEITVR